MPLGRDDFSPSEIGEQLAADRRGQPYLVYRDADSSQTLVELRDRRRVSVGREPGSDLLLAWDGEVSRVHAILERVAGRWTVIDEGLSRNGTFVNEERVSGRRALFDRDVLRFGASQVLFRSPAQVGMETPLASGIGQAARLSDAQRRVLVALCRSAATPGEIPIARTNNEVAEELSISIEAVRTHLKALFRLFEVPELPPNKKRWELMRRAVTAGVVSHRDLL